MLGREQILRLVVAEGKGVLLDFLYLAYIIPATVTHFLSGIAGPINKPSYTLLLYIQYALLTVTVFSSLPRVHEHAEVSKAWED